MKPGNNLNHAAHGSNYYVRDREQMNALQAQCH